MSCTKFSVQIFAAAQSLLLLVGLLSASAVAQAPRVNPNTPSAPPGVPLVEVKTALPKANAKGDLIQNESAGSLDARLMNAALGVDPIALGNSLAESGAPKGFKFTTYEEMKTLPSIDSLFPAPESVCGSDSRTRINPTTGLPWRWNCKLVMTAQNGSKFVGTGWMCGPRLVMTAGHCVHDGGSSGKWMKTIEVIPAMNGSTRPYGTYVSSNLRSVTGWTVSGNHEYDYGAIILSSNAGSRTGYYGYASLSDSSLNGLLVNTAGYPADKPSGTQWYMSGNLSSISTRKLYYNIDTAGGQSGSAVYRLQSGARHAVGIHAYGGCPNGATRITSGVFTNISNWKAL